jgi:peptidoglycan hydrolase CwlO-like protein
MSTQDDVDAAVKALKDEITVLETENARIVAMVNSLNRRIREKKAEIQKLKDEASAGGAIPTTTLVSWSDSLNDMTARATAMYTALSGLKEEPD